MPRGLEFWSVSVHLTQLEVVFLNRFMQEVLGYISLALAMRPPPLPRLAAAADASEAERAAATAAPQQAEEAQSMGIVLQLDVSMDAPIIVMPRNSESADKVCAAS